MNSNTYLLVTNPAGPSSGTLFIRRHSGHITSVFPATSCSKHLRQTVWEHGSIFGHMLPHASYSSEQTPHSFILAAISWKIQGKIRIEEFHFGGSLNLASRQSDFAWVYTRRDSTHTRSDWTEHVITHKISKLQFSRVFRVFKSEL